MADIIFGTAFGPSAGDVVFGQAFGAIYALTPSALQSGSALDSVAMSYAPPGPAAYSLTPSDLASASNVDSVAMSYAPPGGIVTSAAPLSARRRQSISRGQRLQVSTR